MAQGLANSCLSGFFASQNEYVPNWAENVLLRVSCTASRRTDLESIRMDRMENYYANCWTGNYQQCLNPQKMCDPSPSNAIQRAESPQFDSLASLINGDPILAQYFSSQASPSQLQLAHSLMLDGIRYRTTLVPNPKPQADVHKTSKADLHKNGKKMHPNQNYRTQCNPDERVEVKPATKGSSKDNHYNVAYVKHNRFLSPSQRKEYITPKVTETIPHSPPHSKVHIFGKPRVTIDDNYGCPYHEAQEDCLQTIPYGNMQCSPPHQWKDTQPDRQLHVRNFQVEERRRNEAEERRRNEAEERRRNEAEDVEGSKSPPTILKTSSPDILKSSELQGPKREQQRKVAEIVPRQKVAQREKKEESTIYVDKIMSVKTRSPGLVRIINSPKHSGQVHNSPKHSGQVHNSPKHSGQVHNSPKYSGQVHNSPKYSGQMQHFECESEALSESQDFYLTAKNNQKKEGSQKKEGTVESKIKFLIERDKKSKAMEKNMRKQEQRIQHLEMAIKQQSKVPPNKKQGKVPERGLLSLSMDTSMSSLEEHLTQQEIRYRQMKNGRPDQGQFGHKQRKHLSVGIMEESADNEENGCSCSRTFEEPSSDGEYQLSEDESSFAEFNPVFPR